MKHSTKKDEAFWKTQERRREKRLGQPCCTQSGISWSMIELKGRFAVVVHGEKDCLNCFHHHRGESSVQFYSTRLTDAQLTMGDTEEVLEQCLSLIVEEEKPELILVLGTCPVEVVGARFYETVDVVSSKTDIPIIALRTSGLKLSSQQEMLDWLYSTLASLDSEPRELSGLPEERRKLDLLWKRYFSIRPREFPLLEEKEINIIGLSENRFPELKWILNYLGFQVQIFPEKASLDDWRQIKHATHSFMLDIEMFPKLKRVLEEWKQRILPIPPPFGLSSTVIALQRICEEHSRQKELGVFLDDILPLLREERQKMRAYCTGKSMALVIRMRNSNRIQAIALQGLGLYWMFEELGYDIHILIQGATDAAVQDAYAQNIKDYGIQAKCTVFSSPFELRKTLQTENFELICIADQGIEAARGTKAKIVQPEQFQIGLWGAFENWKLLRRV